jgi:hypothetical protein
MLNFGDHLKKIPAKFAFRASKLKGTVARDFLPLGFSTNRPHIVPEFTP